MNVGSDHWLVGVERVPINGGAPMNVRRFLVQHYTAGATAISSINYWKQLGSGVCAHIVIDRDGTIYQCRPFNVTCGHAGSSSWKDPKTKREYTNLNSCSIGIEIANAGDNPTLGERWSDLPLVKLRHKHGSAPVLWEQYPEKQIASVIEVSKALVARYNLDDVVGHDDISPRRKVDPGPAFPMQKVREACGFSGLPQKA